MNEPYYFSEDWDYSEDGECDIGGDDE